MDATAQLSRTQNTYVSPVNAHSLIKLSRRSAPSDADLKQKRAVFSQIVRDQQTTMLRVATRFCQGRIEMAQDLVQDALVRGYEAYLDGRFRENSNARAWLLKILTNSFLNDQRKSNHWTSDREVEYLSPSELRNPGDMMARSTDLPEVSLLEGLLNEPLECALASLSEEMRVCVVLVDIEELTYAETASALKIPIGTVRSRLSRAREILHECLKENYRDR